MSADHLQFLKYKFNNDFAEAVEEFNNELPLRLHFQKINKFLEEKQISPSTPIRMKNSLYDLNYILKECVMLAEKEREYVKSAQKNKKSKCNTRYVKKLWFLYQKKKRLKDILKEISIDDETEIEQDLSSPITNWYSICEPSSYPPQLLHFDDSKIYGFKDHLEKVEKLLEETLNAANGIKAIGIVGMGGVGKTALARMVFESSKLVREKFKSKIWVRLSENFNPWNTSLEEDIIKQRRTKNSRHLIVLDNMPQNSREWYFDMVFKLHQKSPMMMIIIIITSRFEEVASSMVGERNLHTLQPELDGDTCWRIFMDTISRKKFISSNHPILLTMKDEIGDMCGGLPLAAKTLAEIISIQIAKEEYWSNSTVEKFILLKLDAHEVELVSLALNRMGTMPDVLISDALGDPGRHSMVTVRTNLPLKILKQLEKICHAELIEVRRG